MRHRVSPSARLAAALVLICAACADASPEDRVPDAEPSAGVVVTSDAEPADGAGATTCGGAGLGTLAQVRALAPLTDADVARYLRVMHDAADRRARRTADEQALLTRADALQRRALTEGLPATQQAAIDANTLMARADTLRRHLDVVVTREQGGDVGCWLVLRDRVEAIVPSPDGASGFYGDESDAVGQAAADADAAESAEDAELRRRLDAIRAADSVVVTARRPAIVEALRGVRD